MYKFKGFTLAEVLITIGIIGVVVAMTLPSLVKQYKVKVLQTQLKKDYDDLQQVNLRIIASGQSLSDDETTSARAELVMSFFNGKLMVGKDKDWHQGTAQLNKIYNGKGLYRADNNAVTAPLCDNGGVWIDIQGRLWFFNDADHQICVDINGVKLPNKYGYDFFIFYPKNGKIVPHYTDRENEYNYDWNAMADYTYYALIDKHPTEENKTYWKDYIKIK